jgi:hypothetical protein
LTRRDTLCVRATVCPPAIFVLPKNAVQQTMRFVACSQKCATTDDAASLTAKNAVQQTMRFVACSQKCETTDDAASLTAKNAEQQTMHRRLQPKMRYNG